MDHELIAALVTHLRARKKEIVTTVDFGEVGQRNGGDALRGIETIDFDKLMGAIEEFSNTVDVGSEPWTES